MRKAIRILGSVGLLALLAWRVDLSQVASAVTAVDWPWWQAALACYVLAQVVSAVRWRWLARPLGFRRRLGAFTAYYFLGNLFNLILPTSVGGDVARAWYLDGGAGRRGAAFLCVLADRLNGLAVLVLLAVGAALVVPLPAWVVGWVTAAAAATVFGGALVLLAPRFGARLASRSRLVGRLLEVLAVYGRRPGLMGAVTILSLLVQLLNVLLVWCVAVAVGTDVPLSYCFILMPLVTLLTLAPVSVNGMGVREGGTVLLLAPLGIAAGTAVTLALLWFAVFVVAGLGGAAVYLFGHFPRYEERVDDEPVGGHPYQGRTRQPRAAA